MDRPSGRCFAPQRGVASAAPRVDTQGGRPAALRHGERSSRSNHPRGSACTAEGPGRAARLFLAVILASLAAGAGGRALLGSAAAASDPVIAAAGDIACDPSDAFFNGGLG